MHDRFVRYKNMCAVRLLAVSSQMSRARCHVTKRVVITIEIKRNYNKKFDGSMLVYFY